jgi:uncharacterized membrane protein HdeD (DUF308 family)
MATDFATILARHWWIFVVRGVVAILFGVMAFAWPGLTLTTLILLYGAYALVDGVAAIVSALEGRHWPVLVVGVVSLAAGLTAWFFPGLTALALLYVLAFWSIARGIFEIVGAMRLRKVIANEWAWVLAGLASVVFGVLVVLFPGAGALSVIWIIGAYSLVFGVLLVALGVRVKGLTRA